MQTYPFFEEGQRKVIRGTHIFWKGNRYSVPRPYVGKLVWVREHGTSVEIRCSDKLIALHALATQCHQVVTLRHHHVDIPAQNRQSAKNLIQIARSAPVDRRAVAAKGSCSKRVQLPTPKQASDSAKWVLDNAALDLIRHSDEAARPLRLFTVLEAYTRAMLAAKVDIGSTVQLMRMLDKLIARHGCPKVLECRYDPQIMTLRFEEWAIERDITLSYIP